MKKQNINRSQIIYGTRAILEALEQGKELEKILVQRGHQSLNVNEIVKLAHDAQVPYQFVPREKFNTMGDSNHQGVLAFLSPIQYESAEQIIPMVYESGKTPLVIILDRVTDVRNFGAICRSALAAGVDAVIIPDRGSASINEDAVKTSAGALLSLPVCRSGNLKQTIAYLKESGLQVVGCTEKGDKALKQVDFSAPTAIIMGSEEDGISGEYLKLCDVRAMIPMANQMASLNVSVAAGIILYEVIRQRLG